MSKERKELTRLEIIKTNWEYDHINTCDVDWLIEQAERVQELEKESAEWEIETYTQKAGKRHLEQQNKRYREALEEVLKTGDYEDPQDYIDRIVTKACQALEGDLE